MASIGRTNLAIGKSEPKPEPVLTPEETIIQDVKNQVYWSSDYPKGVTYRPEGNKLIARLDESGDDFYGHKYRFFEVDVTVKEIHP